MTSLEAEKRVTGTTPAVVGSIAANEVLKLIIGHGETLVNRMWYIDLLTINTQIIQL
jgi:adenylyltransferase/sulfurtransferase